MHVFFIFFDDYFHHLLYHASALCIYYLTCIISVSFSRLLASAVNLPRQLNSFGIASPHQNLKCERVYIILILTHFTSILNLVLLPDVCVFYCDMLISLKYLALLTKRYLDTIYKNVLPLFSSLPSFTIESKNFQQPQKISYKK